MRGARRDEPLDRGDAPAGQSGHRNETGHARLAVDMDGAGAAEALAADGLGAGEEALAAQDVDERGERIAGKAAGLAVQLETHAHGRPSSVQRPLHQRRQDGDAIPALGFDAVAAVEVHVRGGKTRALVGRDRPIADRRLQRRPAARDGLTEPTAMRSVPSERRARETIATG